ncbi:tetratricopeptide repeat protein [Rubinisphaera margarita]|uniref:tetratricopeptide repeat protein n=1 Tax=Rubinisphaera margarita TaxID=2909586 RepID=UPI001EE89C8C|nr:tetratricopeptide repeat protein [Rubinisphaera margarita]MCG6155939.1 tetratricopeptide repeat protein [Rubinisphaera margarita]
MSQYFQRAQLLWSQSRPDEALTEIGRHLGEEPHDAIALAFRGQLLAALDQKEEALASVREALTYDPELGYAHFAHARILLKFEQKKLALSAIHEAIRINPDEPDFYCTQALIYLQMSDWAKSLTSAETALELNPESEEALNLQSLALRRMGRRRESSAALEAALNRNPEDPFTHTNRGWELLEKGESKQALEHFREALRLDPNMDGARTGIIESLKSRHIVYRQVLKYFFWMSNFSPRTQMLIIFGAWFVVNFLSRVRESLGPAEVLVTPMLYLYLAFVLLSWLSDSFFNLVLRLDPYGRLALDRRQNRQANVLAACLVAATAFLISYFVMSDESLLVGALWSALLAIPATNIYEVRKGRPRQAMTLATIALGAALLTHVYLYMAVIDPQLERINAHRLANAAKFEQADRAGQAQLLEDEFTVPVLTSLQGSISLANRLFRFVQFGILAACFVPALLPSENDRNEVDVKLN